jgi:hypothetical protein
MGFCRRALLLALFGLLALATPARAQEAALADEVAIGSSSAPVTLVVYTSITCRHCREFHAAVWPQLEADYVDRGLMRLVLREVSIPPQEVSAAAFQLARCDGANAEAYFQRLTAIFALGDAVMRYEPLILSPSGKVISGGAYDATPLRQAGATFGLSASQVEACIQDVGTGQERAERLLRNDDFRFRITGVPTLALNGEMLDMRDPSVQTFAGLSRLIDQRIAAADRAPAPR